MTEPHAAAHILTQGRELGGRSTPRVFSRPAWYRSVAIGGAATSRASPVHVTHVSGQSDRMPARENPRIKRAHISNLLAVCSGRIGGGKPQRRVAEFKYQTKAW